MNIQELMKIALFGLQIVFLFPPVTVIVLSVILLNGILKFKPIIISNAEKAAFLRRFLDKRFFPHHFILLLTAIIGVSMGLINLAYAAAELFVLSNDDHWSALIALLAGPASTLPAVITAIFFRRIGGYWLCTGSVIAFIAEVLYPGQNMAYLRMFGIYLTSPMLALGAMFLLLDYFLAKTERKAVPNMKPTDETI